MKGISQIKAVAEALKGVPVAVFFSGGKDGIAALDIWRRYHDGPRRYCYLYYVPGLSFVDSTLRYYEKLWGMEVEQYPCYETKSMLAARARTAGEKVRKTKYMLRDDEDAFLTETGFEHSLWGMKKSDSLSRRIFLNRGEGVFDGKAKRICPLVDWTDKEVRAYCKINRLPMMSCYSRPGGDGNSFWIPTLAGLLWLREQYPGDFRRVLNYFPELETQIVRHDGVVL